jgi:serine protease Do
MKKFKIDLNKIHLISRFHIHIKKEILSTVLVSFFTVAITIGIVLSVIWQNRTEVFGLLATSYIQDQDLNNDFSDETGVVPETKDIKNDLATILPSIVQEENTVVSAVKKANPAVVSIVITKEVPKYDISYESNNDIFGNLFFQTPIYKQNGTEKKKVGGGSGFLVSSDGLMVTNRHVVSDTAADFTVYLNSGDSYPATVLARDSVFDIAILKINPPLGTKFPYLELGDSDKLDVGQSVVAIGNALGEFKNTVSVGVVSGLSRSVIAGDGAGHSEQLSKVIQTDAAINPGNSGGPLLDLSGKVVGVNVAIVQGSQNIGFSLPINSVKSIIDSVKRTGKIIRPYVGIRFIPITSEVKAKNNLSVDYGILVQRGQTASDLAVIPGSPADKAGILENDIILELDGKKIDEKQDFAYLIRDKSVGDFVALKVLSRGVQKVVTLRLEQAPDNM